MLDRLEAGTSSDGSWVAFGARRPPKVELPAYLTATKWARVRGDEG